MQGTVKWFNEKKGYGFITSQAGYDVFAHYSDIQTQGFKSLSDGEAVEFEIISTDRGKRAIHIVKFS